MNNFPDKDSFSSFEKKLQAKTPAVRREALAEVGDIDDLPPAEAVHALNLVLDAVQDRDRDVRLAAAEVLHEFVGYNKMEGLRPFQLPFLSEIKQERPPKPVLEVLTGWPLRITVSKHCETRLDPHRLPEYLAAVEFLLGAVPQRTAEPKSKWNLKK